MQQKLLSVVHGGDLALIKEFYHQHFGVTSATSWKDCVYSKTGDSALHVAARTGHLHVLKYLHDECGMNIEQTNLDGKRPLHEAAQYSQPDCVEYLLRQGAAVDSMKRADWTALMLACTKSNMDVIRILIEEGAAASLSMRNKDGWTCFHLACRQGQADIIAYLLALQPQIWQTTSRNGRTPLHTAALHGHLNVVELLIQHGDINWRAADNCGTTPFMDAVRSGHIAVARYLLQCDMDCSRDRDGMRRHSLHLAAQAGCAEAINFLLDECGVEIDVLSGDGSDALFFAAREGLVEAAGILLDRGVDTTRSDHHGRSALEVAKSFSRQECAQLIQSQLDRVNSGNV